MKSPILVGAVVYDPKVVVIWDIIKQFFEAEGTPIDYIFFSNYELQVEALKNGQIDVAWNSPLAWIDSLRRCGSDSRAIAMRDTDQDRRSHFIARKDSGIHSLADLKGKRIGFGAKDSPQATLIPMAMLSRIGLEAGRDYEAKLFDVLVGKHGDHIGGERDALEALKRGEVDASTVLDLNWQLWSSDGTIDSGKFGVIADTDLFDHCVFTVRSDFAEEDQKRFLDTLFRMTYDNPDHREMMDMEGLKEWKPGRTTGFGPLTEAVTKQNYFNP